ncbi:unnamed protein product, partial [Porites evermanni]
IFSDAIFSFLNDTYQRISELPDPKPHVKYPREPGYRPAPEENPFNAWYWRCNIVGTPSGKLLGKTIAMKDTISVAGIPMMCGSHLLEGYIPDYDATVVSRILDAGGTITGKAVCEEWCFTATSCTSFTGPVVNPYDEKRMALGSSSGCAALVAGGKVDMAMGGDQGGSIRIPAAACGIVGLKPTYGLVPYTGIIPVHTCLDHTGPMARTMKDVALLLEVVAGSDGDLDPRQPRDLSTPAIYTSSLTGNISGLRIGLLKEGFNMSDADMKIMTMVKEAADRLSSLGATVGQVSVPIHFDGIRVCDALCMEGGYRLLSGSNSEAKGFVDTSLQAAIGRGFTTRGKDLGPVGKLTMILGALLHEDSHGVFHGKAINLARKLYEEYDKALKFYDVLIMPTIINQPPKVPDSGEVNFGNAFDFCENTGPFNVTGHPALTINAGFSDGLPVGMMIVGRKFDEATVLNVAFAYERLRDTS